MDTDPASPGPPPRGAPSPGPAATAREVPFDPSEAARVGPLLRIGHQRAARSFTAALDGLDIEGRHYGVLHNLATRGPLSQRRLIELTGSEKSSMVRTVDDLEARGYAVRRPSPVDRRAHAVEITEAGRAVCERATVIANEVGGGLLACFTPEEREVFLALLTRFVAAQPGFTSSP
jgi:DNA-binding MarR family transcriptional regulator